MKKFFIIFFYSFVFTFVVSSQERPYGMGGCGFGSTVFDKKSKFRENMTKNGLFSIKGNFVVSLEQALASYLNWHLLVSSNQSSAITTGTLNCVEDGVVKKKKEQEIFVYINYESLEQEAAIGKGDKLETLAILFGCQKFQKQFKNMVKTKYKNLFFDVSNTPAKIVNSIQNEINNHQSLKNLCKI